MTLILGVDGGNTKTIALVAAADGTILGAGRGGCSDIYGAPSREAAIKELETAVDAALAAAGCSREDINTGCFSMAGADWPEDYAYLEAQIRALGLARDPQLANDALGALRAGVIDGVGAVIACGTGAATAARNADGRFWHASFWQENMGGAEIGYHALRAVYRAELGIDPPTSLTAPALAYFQQPNVEEVLRLFTMKGRLHPTYREVSRFAPFVLREAARGDAAACAIVDHQGRRLVEYALACARKVDLIGQPFRLVLNGGIFRDAGGKMVEAIRAEVVRCAPGVTLVMGRYEPAVGALIHAFDRAGYLLDTDRIALLEASLPQADLFVTSE
jgi:N-acetylglucosamine kinase-like BadF-type ATPase